jgi:ribonuclease PH
MSSPRREDELRPIAIQTGFLEKRRASVLFSMGLTRVLCSATLEAGVPLFLEGRRKGWATAEYDMLPGATSPRRQRERAGKVSGRTLEIQRMIGRSIRGVLDLAALDGFTLALDCDVLQADGGTRTASVNGAFVAASIAIREAMETGKLTRSPLTQALGAVSAGISGGKRLLDLDYAQDSSADVDLNLVATESGALLEIQATSERKPFTREDLDHLVLLGMAGIREIIERSRAAIAAS